MTDKFIEDKKNKIKVDTTIEGKTGEIDFNTLKSGGLIKQRQKEVTAKLQGIEEAAKDIPSLL